MTKCDTAATVPFGVPVTVTDFEVSPAIGSRLQSFGIRPGAQIICLYRTAGGGRTISVASSQIALGKNVLAGLKVSADQ